METIIRYPGLHHLAEKVFWNLDGEDLRTCAQMNQFCKQILQHPIFCLSKFEHVSKKNQLDWVRTIKSVENFDKGIAVISYLKWNLKKEDLDPLCYSNPAAQVDFTKKIWESCGKPELSDEDKEIVKILPPLTDNPNGADEVGQTAIHRAAYNGHTEIVEILASLIDSP